MRLWIVAGVAFALFLILGYYVSSQPRTALDLWSATLRGHDVPLAVVFTQSGYFVPLLLIGLIGVALTALIRMPLWIGFAVLASQIVSQGAVELIKQLFHRARPDVWFFQHELGYAYPSGHACTAIVFYGAWLLIVLFARIPLAVKTVVGVFLVAWMLGIDWSRLALGAHYPTDVLGGTLFGIFWLSAVVALLLHFGLLERAFTKR